MKRTTRSTLPDPEVTRYRPASTVNRLHHRALHLATVRQMGGAR